MSLIIRISNVPIIYYFKQTFPQIIKKEREDICKTLATVIIFFLILNSFKDNKDNYRGRSQVQKYQKESKFMLLNF